MAQRGLKLNLNKDECNSIAYLTLWKCLLNFNENNGKFEPYLKRSIRNNLIQENKKTIFIELKDVFSYNHIKLSLDSLTLNEKILIKQKYWYNYTLKEMAYLHNCSHEQIRGLLNKILEKLKRDHLNGV